MRATELKKSAPVVKRTPSYEELLEEKLNSLLHTSTPKFTPLQIAAMEGGHSIEVDEGWKDIAAAGAVATSLALGGFGALNKKQADDPTQQAQPTQQVQPIQTQPKAPIALSSNAHAETALQRAAMKAGIKGTELAQFLAQTRHESADFSRMTELGTTKYFKKMYDPKYNPKKAKRLGNVEPGDGIKYRGRGFIQITGRENYRKAGEALGLPLEDRPELAEKPDVATKIAIWYWKTRVVPYVQNFADTVSVTKKINPGLKGLKNRIEYFNDYQENI